VNGYAYYLGDDYATITDFNYLEGDKFQVYGSSADYSLGTSNWSGSDALDTGIYYQGNLIAVVQDTTDVRQRWCTSRISSYHWLTRL
jgi:hypothetical protein